MAGGLLPEIFPTGGCCGRGTGLEAVLAVVAVDSFGAPGNFGPVVLTDSELLPTAVASFLRGFAAIDETIGEVD